MGIGFPITREVKVEDTFQIVNINTPSNQVCGLKQGDLLVFKALKDDLAELDIDVRCQRHHISLAVGQSLFSGSQIRKAIEEG